MLGAPQLAQIQTDCEISFTPGRFRPGRNKKSSALTRSKAELKLQNYFINNICRARLMERFN